MSIRIKNNRFILTSILLFCISSGLMANQQPLNMVTVKEAKLQQVSPTVWLSGNVENRLSARIASEQNGRLIWILDVGDKVKAGDAIAKLDNRNMVLQKAERQAQLRQQEANILYLDKQQKRLNALLTNNSTARIELDRVIRDLNVAKEQQAALQIQIKQIQLAIEKATILAPFDGQINRRLAQQGEYVNAGTPVVQLVDPTRLDISVAAPLSLAPYLTSQGMVLVKWDNKLHSLPIRTWSPTGDQSSRTFNVRLDASNLQLLGGTGVTVSLPSASVTDATMVPRDALILRDKQTFVVTVDKQQVAHKVEVKVGRGIGDWISIDGSVQAGQQVIVRGGERLQDGQKVRIMEPAIEDTSAIAAN